MLEEQNTNLMQQLLETFREEGVDHLRALNNALLAYERAEEPAQQQEAIQTAFRAAHSLKGAARAVSLGDIQKLAHAMETVFQQVRDQQHRLSSTDCDRLYDALDLLNAHLSGETPSTAALSDHLLQLAGQTQAQSVEVETPLPITQTQPSASRTAGEETIRVSLQKLDDLMAEVGEMLVTRSSASARQTDIRAIRQMLEGWTKSWSEIKLALKRHNGAALLEMYTAHADLMQGLMDAFARLEQLSLRDSARLGILTDNLQDKVRRLRMIPFHSQRLHLERVVRDTARQTGKQVRFEMTGEHTELDKQVLETLKAPLLHLLSNAVVHGIEPPQVRLKHGKSEEGCVRLQVQQRGSEVRIHVSDDGQGFDSARIQSAYQARYGEIPTGETAVRLAFAHGVTTVDGVDEVAGRGVGLDVVNVSVAALHGRVTVNTTPNEGTTVTLSVPTSLAITRNLMVKVGREIYALPLLAVDTIVPVGNTLSIGGRAALQVEERVIPLVSLAQLLQLPPEESPAADQDRLALIIEVGDRALAVSVDDVLTEQELAIKPLTYPLKSVTMVAGVALQGSGQPVIVLNPGDFLSAYRHAQFEYRPQRAMKTEETELSAALVLVVDDSITTRTLERNILQAAGYRVVTATDGLEALNRLQEHPVQIVISDVEMPNLNGFALTRALRADERYEDMPIILVTSRERDEDRQEGMVAGANAYIVKRGFDQTELLSIIAQLL
jgi:two-component system, chemotaxis family, sensor kinase CheA